MYCAVLASVLQVLVLPVLVILELACPASAAMRKQEENRRTEERQWTGYCLLENVTQLPTTWPTFRLAQPLFLKFCTLLFLYIYLYSSTSVSMCFFNFSTLVFLFWRMLTTCPLSNLLPSSGFLNFCISIFSLCSFCVFVFLFWTEQILKHWQTSQWLHSSCASDIWFLVWPAFYLHSCYANDGACFTVL